MILLMDDSCDFASIKYTASAIYGATSPQEQNSTVGSCNLNQEPSVPLTPEYQVRMYMLGVALAYLNRPPAPIQASIVWHTSSAL